MSLILALDTSTEACSCAVYADGKVVSEYAHIPRQHAQRILPMIRSLLTDQKLELTDFDAIAFGRGPGSFTGLRIAAGVTQGLASASDLPVIPISTLKALAWQAYTKHGYQKVLACLDARIDEVYWGAYSLDEQGVNSCSDDFLCKPEAISEAVASDIFADQSFSVCGNGLSYLERFPAYITERMTEQQPQMLPDAAAIAWLAAGEWSKGNTVSAENVQPVYLRDKVTHQ